MIEWVLINNSWPLRVPEHRAAQWNTPWEEARLTAMHDRVRPGSIVYYIGAESGDIPALLATWGAEVVLVEPDTTTWPTIRATFEANKVVPLNALHAFASTVDSLINPTLVKGPGFLWPVAADGPIVTEQAFRELHSQADDFNQIRVDRITKCTMRPDVISVDVEGAEWEVLKGAEDTLSLYHPTLFVSIHPELMMLHWSQYSRDLRDWICEHGYTETILDYQHELHCLYEAA